MSTPPISAAERAHYYHEISSKYTHTDGWSMTRRHWEYLRIPHAYQTECQVSAVSIITSTACTGAFFGRIAGGQIEKVIRKDRTATFVGPCVGAGVGFLGGGVVGSYLYMTAMEKKSHFKQWKAQCLDRAIREAVTFDYAEDKILSHFTCPRFLCILDIPARTPSGVIYDYEALEHDTRSDSFGFITDPCGHPSFHEKQTLPDFEMSTVIHKRILYLIEGDIASLKGAEEHISPLLKKRDVVKEMIKERYEKARDFIESRRRENIVPHAQYKTEIAEFENLFGIDAREDLNWDLDWKSILDTRWKNFYPKAVILNEAEVD